MMREYGKIIYFVYHRAERFYASAMESSSQHTEVVFKVFIYGNIILVQKFHVSFEATKS